MPVKFEDRMNAARAAMGTYQLQGNTIDPYAKTKATLRQGLNRSNPYSFVSQAITAAGGNPLEYTTGALVGKGVKAIANAFKK